MNTQHALILSLILLVAIGVILFFIRLYLKWRKYSPPKLTPHDEKYIPPSNVQFSLQSDYYKPTSEGLEILDSDCPDDTPAATHIFDVFQQNSFDNQLFGGGDFGGGGAGDSYSSDSGSSDSSSWSDSSSSDSSSDSSSSSWSD